MKRKGGASPAPTREKGRGNGGIGSRATWLAQRAHAARAYKRTGKDGRPTGAPLHARRDPGYRGSEGGGAAEPGGLLRGTIDCLVQDAAGVVTVIEIKTGRARPEHQAQLDLYLEAARSLYPGRPVRGLLLHP